MKRDIHPKYYDNATITCSCGNTFTTGSTVEHLEVEICSACHPFYTGTQKLVDTEGRVERFEKRKKVAKTATELKAKHKAKKEMRKRKSQNVPKTLKEMVEREKKKIKSKDLAKAAMKVARKAKKKEEDSSKSS